MSKGVEVMRWIRCRMALSVWLLLCGSPLLAAPEPHEGQGFLRLTLPGGGPKDFLKVRNLKDGKDYQLGSTPDLGDITYGQWVPAGEYDVPVVSGGKPYPPVVVETGRLTNLGALILVNLGGYEIMSLPIQHPVATADADRAIERLGAELKQREPLLWQPAQAPATRMTEDTALSPLGVIGDLIAIYDRESNRPPLIEQVKAAKTAQEIYPLAMSYAPPTTDEPGVDEQGRLYYGARLGQIRVRNPGGEWSYLDTGTFQAITAVEASGALLVAGTYSGRLLASNDGGHQWTEVAALDAGETIVDIDRLGERWLVVTAPIRFNSSWNANTVGSMTVYASEPGELAKLRVIRKITFPDNQQLGAQGVLGGQASARHYFVNGIKELHRLDPSTMEWSTLPLPTTTHAVHVNARTGTLTAYRQQSFLSKLYVSSDEGATWKQHDTPPSVFIDVVFTTPDQGWATRRNMSAFHSTIEFHSYDAAKDRWNVSHESPRMCERALRDADGVSRFCLMPGFSILNRVDGKWVVEFAMR